MAWLQGSAIGHAIRESGVWTYGVVNLVHILGVATLFGSVLILDLRLIGLWRNVALPAISNPTIRVATAGFVIAAPLMAYGIAISKIVPGAQDNSDLVFGIPPLMHIFNGIFHPGTEPTSILLNPIGRAAWFGLFATALNLLPVWQLDGGHILYSLASKKHKEISLAVSLGLIGLGIYRWRGWALWGIVLLILSLRFRHPPVYDRWEELNASRKLLAILAVAIFALCFTVWPFNNLDF